MKSSLATTRGDSTNGYRSGWPIARAIPFSASDSPSHAPIGSSVADDGELDAAASPAPRDGSSTRSP